MMLPDKPPPLDPKDSTPTDLGGNLTPGQTVRTLREVCELSQSDLARETGIPQTTISAIENGRANLRAEQAKVFARALNAHLGTILFPDWKPSAACWAFKQPLPGE